ncbi:DUF4328 domain-containing protein [Streptomyces sp. NRRL B-24484]|uniref:DUF4328 domain-containing protein n=1 Tax=Streptomyces sp. NRRL B-24484 TaxID=1463833 RepID=UPI0004BE8C93|nr:DUF4328 domain-containing protein [Streptomyces sp. NRRL B-24484]
MHSQEPGAAPEPVTPAVRDPRRPAAVAQAAIWAELLALAAVMAVGGKAGEDLPAAVPIMTLLGAVALVAVICWLRRCRHNAEAFAPGTHRYSPGFAIGGWFVPVAMLWIPRRVTLDVRRAGGPVGRAWLVEAWWWTRLAKVAVALVCARSLPNPMFSPYVALLTAASGIMLSLVIREITTAQVGRITARPTETAPLAAV